MIILKPLEGRGGRRSLALLHAHSYSLGIKKTKTSETLHSKWRQSIPCVTSTLLIHWTGDMHYNQQTVAFCRLSLKKKKAQTWTIKRMLMFLYKLSSVTTSSNFDHSLAADIRGITWESSSNRTSGGKTEVKKRPLRIACTRFKVRIYSLKLRFWY